MWFSPLKGAHLTLGQLDKTLPVDMGYKPSGSTTEVNKGIRRGSFVYIRATTAAGATCDPSFSLYTAAVASEPNAVPYIALMSVYDFQAGMAGSVGQAPATIGADDAGTAPATTAEQFLNKSNVLPGVQGPRITAISVVQPAEYQTTAFKKLTSGNYYVGQPLTIENGILAPFESGKNIVGYVTAVPKLRWINDLGADEMGARISGGNKEVIEFSTAWIPVAAAGQPGTSGAGKTPGALNVGAPKVQAAPAEAPKGNEAPKAK